MKVYTFGYFYSEFDDITPADLNRDTSDIEHYKNMYDFPIWNTSESDDRWLVKNCNIQSFRDQMLEVYPHNWSGFKKQTWVPTKNNKPKYRR